MKAIRTGVLQNISKRDLGILIIAAAIASGIANVVPSAVTLVGLPVNILAPTVILALALGLALKDKMDCATPNSESGNKDA